MYKQILSLAVIASNMLHACTKQIQKYTINSNMLNTTTALFALVWCTCTIPIAKASTALNVQTYLASLLNFRPCFPTPWQIARKYTNKYKNKLKSHIKLWITKFIQEVELNQGNLIQGKAQVTLKNWKNLFGDQREDSLTSLEVCYLLKWNKIASYY